MTLNFCSGRETTVREIAELICGYFGLDPHEFIQKQPGRPGDVMRHLGDNSCFKELMGFAPEIAMAEGIRSTIDWFRSLPLTPEELLSQEVVRNWE